MCVYWRYKGIGFRYIYIYICICILGLYRDNGKEDGKYSYYMGYRFQSFGGGAL